MALVLKRKKQKVGGGGVEKEEEGGSTIKRPQRIRNWSIIWNISAGIFLISRFASL